MVSCRLRAANLALRFSQSGLQKAAEALARVFLMPSFSPFGHTDRRTGAAQVSQSRKFFQSGLGLKMERGSERALKFVRASDGTPSESAWFRPAGEAGLFSGTASFFTRQFSRARRRQNTPFPGQRSQEFWDSGVNESLYSRPNFLPALRRESLSDQWRPTTGFTGLLTRFPPCGRCSNFRPNTIRTQFYCLKSSVRSRRGSKLSAFA